MATYYAWSPIKSGESKPDGQTATVNVGEKVTAGDLFLDDADFQQLIDSGAVRTMPYPDVPDTWQDSPINFLLKQAKDAAEGIMADTQASPELSAAAQMQVAAATGSPEAQALAVEQPDADEVNTTPEGANTTSEGGNGV